MRRSYPYIVTVCLALTVLAFQNCSQAQFTAEEVTGNDSKGDGLGGDGGGGGGGGGGGSGGLPLSEVEVEQNCLNRSLQSINSSVSFPTPASCSWGNLDNLNKRNGYAQARSEQEFVLPVPANAVICKLEFNFPNQQMRYDDQVIMTYNQYVLASSYQGLIELLPKVDGLYKYQWSSLKGKETDVVGYRPYIAGKDEGLASIQMPQTETTGQIQMNMNDQVFYKFAAKKAAGASHKFGFVTTGDDDNSDCQHLPVNFTVKASYYVP